MKTFLSKYYLLALMLTNFYIFQSCEKVDQEIVGSGIVIEEERSNSDFTEVEVSGEFTINFTKDSNFSVLINGDNNVLPFVNTHVDGNVLKISSDENVQISNANIEINISLPELTRFVSQGNVIATSTNKLSGNVLTVDANGESYVDFILQINYLTVNIQGTGAALFKGTAKECFLDLSGNVAFTSNLMEVSDLELNKEGNVEATVYTSEKLVISSKGAGDIYCYGNPEYIEQDIKGNGKLILR